MSLWFYVNSVLALVCFLFSVYNFKKRKTGLATFSSIMTVVYLVLAYAAAFPLS